MHLFNSLEYIILTSKAVSVRMLRCWLLDNEAYYLSCRAHWQRYYGSLPTLSSSCMGAYTQERVIFIQFYEKVKSVVEYQEFDTYAERQLSIYESIRDDKIQVKDWLIKNEKYGKGELPTYFPPINLYKKYAYGASDGDERERINSLLIKVASFDYQDRSFHILIKRAEFNNIYAFDSLFHDLYYVQQRYPEGIEKEKRYNEALKLSLEEEETENS